MDYFYSVLKKSGQNLHSLHGVESAVWDRRCGVGDVELVVVSSPAPSMRSRLSLSPNMR